MADAEQKVKAANVVGESGGTKKTQRV
jgi:hypothetical protein